MQNKSHLFTPYIPKVVCEICNNKLDSLIEKDLAVNSTFIYMDINTFIDHENMIVLHSSDTSYMHFLRYCIQM